MNMIPLSVVMVVKNEEEVIERCLKSVQAITDDLLVFDTGSTDSTITIAKNMGAKVIPLQWQGYGKTKNEANSYAKYDWILSLDADEFIDEDLIESLTNIKWESQKAVFRIRRKRYFMNKLMRFGACGHEKRIRIFPHNSAKWTDDLVHETLQVNDVDIITINGSIYDQTFKNLKQFSQKMENYADMCARKYFSRGVKGAAWKRYLSPIYTFMWNYFIRLGLLDGKAGLIHAYMIAAYTYRKYSILFHLEKKK